MSSSQAQWRRSLLEFIKVTVETAGVFLALSVTTNDLRARGKCVELARKAYGSALHFQGLIQLPSSEAEVAAGKMMELQTRLEGSGKGAYKWPATEKGTMSPRPEEKSVADWAREFERACARAREEAHQMLALNREIVSRTRG